MSMEPDTGPTNTPAAATPAASSSIAAKYKIVFLGDAYVGKTCLINRFMYDTFDAGYQVGVKSNAIGDGGDRLPLQDYVR